MLMFMLGLLFVCIATGISLLWIYTGGHLDQRSIERALPVIKKDVDATATIIGKKAEGFYEKSAKMTGPYLEGVAVKGVAAWEELKKRSKGLAFYLNQNLGPYCCSALGNLKLYWSYAQEMIFEYWKWIKPKFFELWNSARPYFQKLGEFIIEQSQLLYTWLAINVPIYWNILSANVIEIFGAVSKTVDGWING